MKKIFWIPRNYFIFAVIILFLIGAMYYRSVPRWDVRYTADFPGMHVELYPQKSVSKESCIYHDFILKVNDRYIEKNWEWRAGTSEDDVCAPAIYYADINDDREKELIFVFWNRIDRGTGVFLNHIYIVDSDGKDHPIENPMQYLQEHLQSSLHRTEAGIVVDISIDENTNQLFYNKECFPDLKGLDSHVGHLDWTEYQIDGQTLYAKVPFIVYQGMVIGYYHLQYTEIDGSYVITNVFIEQLSEEGID